MDACAFTYPVSAIALPAMRGFATLSTSPAVKHVARAYQLRCTKRRGQARALSIPARTASAHLMTWRVAYLRTPRAARPTLCDCATAHMRRETLHTAVRARAPVGA